MTKKILVHECGYVVNPGDTLTPNDGDGTAQFVGLYGTSGMLIQVNWRKVRSRPIEFAGIAMVSVFNCSVMEIDDE